MGAGLRLALAGCRWPACPNRSLVQRHESPDLGIHHHADVLAAFKNLEDVACRKRLPIVLFTSFFSEARRAPWRMMHSGRHLFGRAFGALGWIFDRGKLRAAQPFCQRHHRPDFEHSEQRLAAVLPELPEFDIPRVELERKLYAAYHLEMAFKALKTNRRWEGFRQTGLALLKNPKYLGHRGLIKEIGISLLGNSWFEKRKR
jgi:hypothetical protein